MRPSGLKRFLYGNLGNQMDELMKLLEWIVTHPEELIRAGKLAVIIVRRLLKRQRVKKQNPDNKPG